LKKHLWIILTLIAALVFQVLYSYPRLPERVASHFNGAGQPDGWTSRGMFFLTYLGILSLVILIFLVLPLALRRLPAGMINLPNRDYWLAPERRAETFAFIGRQLLWFGTATLAFLGLTFQLTIQANLSPRRHLPTTFLLVALGIYGAFIALWLIRFLLRFKKPAGAR